MDITSIILDCPSSDIEKYINRKRKVFSALSTFYGFYYYFSRVITAISAAVLPFIITNAKFGAWSTSLSIIIAVLVAIDIVLNPSNNWKKYSKAATDLKIEDFKENPNFDKYAEKMKIILGVENKENLAEIHKILQEIKKK